MPERSEFILVNNGKTTPQITKALGTSIHFFLYSKGNDFFCIAYYQVR
jgi:hypothetical protein